MIREADKKLYELFNQFIQRVIIERKDFFAEGDELLLTQENLNECKRRFIEKIDESGDKFDAKARGQFEGASESSKRLFAHAIWLWGFSVNESKDCNLLFINNTKPVQNGFANSGQYHLTNKYEEVCFCIRLFDALLSKDCKTDLEAKKQIENICLCCAYGNVIDAYEELKDTEIVTTYKTVSMINILLYLCFPENYERIVSNGHKQKIANCFETLLSDDEKSMNLEQRIKGIRDKLKAQLGEDSFDFYDHKKICSLWNLSASDESSDEFEGLKFKKNIIFYGPPGTSKTYSAKRLSESFILRELLSSDLLTLKQYLKKDYDIERYIYRLQLHANYGYENFIIGQTMVEGRIETVKGYFLELSEAAARDTAHPYVLILDEINRVDLARLFGEAFSCIETRNEPVDLPYKIDDTTVKLSVPDNLYIIGTMNEIDFSLERLDFALRRRFLWFKHGYNEDALYEMLNEISNEWDKDIFISRATALNEKIRDTRELGEQYEIGHVFFAEIQSIIQRYSNKRLYSSKRTPNPKEPVITLWKISIRPMLEAYLDNVDVDVKTNILKELENIYYGKE